MCVVNIFFFQINLLLNSPAKRREIRKVTVLIKPYKCKVFGNLIVKKVIKYQFLLFLTKENLKKTGVFGSVGGSFLLLVG